MSGKGTRPTPSMLRPGFGQPGTTIESAKVPANWTSYFKTRWRSSCGLQCQITIGERDYCEYHERCIWLIWFIWFTRHVGSCERNCGGDVGRGYGRLSHSLSNRPTNGRGRLTPQLGSHRTNRGRYKMFTHATCPRVRFILRTLAPSLTRADASSFCASSKETISATTGDHASHRRFPSHGGVTSCFLSKESRLPGVSRLDSSFISLLPPFHCRNAPPHSGTRPTHVTEKGKFNSNTVTVPRSVTVTGLSTGFWFAFLLILRSHLVSPDS